MDEGRIELKFSVVQIDFCLKVPADINFYSAHFKIDAFRYFSGFPGERFNLIDLDVVCLGDYSVLSQLSDDIVVYDITREISEEFGLDRLCLDFSLLGLAKNNLKWYGGEFISAPASFYGDLYARVKRINERYLSCYKKLHHQGDEMLVSCAINEMTDAGVRVVDASSMGVIHRHWSGVAGYNQLFLWSVIFKLAFIHLPQDKKMLAWFSSFIGKSFSVPFFILSYAFYDAYRSFRNIAVRLYRGV